MPSGSSRVSVPLVMVMVSVGPPEMLKALSVLMFSVLTVRLTTVCMLVPEVKLLPNSTSLVCAGATPPTQLAPEPQLVLPAGAAPFQMLVTASAELEKLAASAAAIKIGRH